MNYSQTHNKREGAWGMWMRIGFVCVVSMWAMPFIASAYTISSTSAPIRGDFVLEPAKVELTVAPGDITETELRMVNRTEETLNFTIDIEDTKGSDDASRSVILLGDEEGPYPLRAMVRPEINSFTLKSQEEIRLPVTILIPEDIEPGGHYGSVLFESSSAGDTNTGSRTVSRLGALFFVRVEGEVEEEGTLERFRVKDGPIFFGGDQLMFEFTYRNSGSVHLNPYGMITVKNMIGASVAELEVLPYFSMPQSLRARELTWEHGPLFGFYSATLEQNRGYDDLIDTETVHFVVLPWKIIAIALIVIIALILLGKWFTTTFEFKKKTK
jgi:hypothetical protein